MSFGDRVMDFNRKLHFDGIIPSGFQVINPFQENPNVLDVAATFYKRFYGDDNDRRLLLGINPSRNGAAVTGIPFTDTKRLESQCGIEIGDVYTHEISSVFIYDMIDAYGGVDAFYQDIYINSPFPLALVRENGKSLVNVNYYDDKILSNALRPFMMHTMEQHISLGIHRDEVFIMGKKNATFIDQINRERGYFKKLTILEHPRYIQQYKLSTRQSYIDKYLKAFGVIH